MFLQNIYWNFKKVLTEDFCNKAIDVIKKEKLQKGVIHEERILQKKVRNSDTFFKADDLIYNQIIPFIKTANENAGWNYEWDWSEDIQFTKYEKGNHYDWHIDVGDPYENTTFKEYDGKIRKLSCIVSLNDSSEYEGGEVLIDDRMYREDKKRKERIFEVKELKEKGTIIVFPSFCYHKVKPILKGTRYSLVMWFLGKPFK